MLDSTENQIHIIQSVTTSVSVLSIIGSLVIIVSYLRYKALRRYTFQLVALMSANDFVNQITDMIAPSPADIVAMHQGAPMSSQCIAQATIHSYVELSAVGWATTISVTLYLMVTKRWPAERVQAQFVKLVASATVIPAAVALTGLALHAYGPSFAWCWVDPHGDRAWYIWVSYVLVWAAIVFNAFTFMSAHRALKTTITLPSASDMGNDDEMARLRSITARLRGYPLILLLVWTFPTVLRVLGTFGITNFALIVITRFMVSTQGALNAIAWMQPRVRAAIRADLAKIFPCLYNETGLTAFADPRAVNDGPPSCCSYWCCCGKRRREPSYAVVNISSKHTGARPGTGQLHKAIALTQAEPSDCV